MYLNTFSAIFDFFNKLAPPYAPTRKKWPAQIYTIFDSFSVKIDQILHRLKVEFGHFQLPPTSSYEFLWLLRAKKWDSKIFIKIDTFFTQKIDPKTPKIKVFDPSDPEEGVKNLDFWCFGVDFLGEKGADFYENSGISFFCTNKS